MVVVVTHLCGLWFEEEHKFYVSLGGDRAPFGKHDTACAWLVGFLNIDRGILSSNENFLLFSANCSENCIPVQRYIKMLVSDIQLIEQQTFKCTFNKSRKSFVAKLGEGKCSFLGVRGPQKSWRNNIRVRVRALTVMDIESHVRAGLPRGEVTERCEDQDEGKGPRRYGPCSLLPVCASPWAKCGRVDTTFRPAFFISS